MKRTILYAAAALLLGGCFKSVGYDTDVILKSWVQTESAAELKPAQGVVAYAFEADTVTWTVASYEDALNGVLTRKGCCADELIPSRYFCEICITAAIVSTVSIIVACPSFG